MGKMDDDENLLEKFFVLKLLLNLLFDNIVRKD
jgi:hypothetical protein